jgi:branched-chain amino acid transport system substrate-binding protein
MSRRKIAALTVAAVAALGLPLASASTAHAAAAAKCTKAGQVIKGMTCKAKAPSGTKVKIGYIWSGVSAAIDNSADEKTMRAEVKYLNEFGGGIGGHPVDVSVCATNSDAALAAKCGDQVIADKVSIVLFNVIGEIGQWATKVLEAKIPIFAYSSADASLLKGGDVFTMSNPIAGLAAFPASVAKKNGFKTAAISVINVPAASGPVNGLAPPFFGAVGAKVDIVPIAPDAPDHTADVQAALKSNPELWHIIGNPAYCTLDIKALRTAGYKGKITMISNCLDPAAVKALGADLKGILVSFASGEDPANADTVELKAILKKYAPSVVPQGTPVGTYLVWESFRRIMANQKAVDSASMIAAIKATDGTIGVPTMTGSTIKCDGKQVPGIAIACVSGFLVGELNDQGVVASFAAP